MDTDKVEAVRKDIELYAYALLMKITLGEIPLELGLERIFYILQDKRYFMRYFLLEIYKNTHIGRDA
ncbi:hypothetical protein [Hydrogenobaculum acidophilum]